MNEIERHVLEQIGENIDSPDVFTDTPEGIKPIRDSINDAIQEAAMLFGGRTTKFLIPLHHNRTFYRLRFNHGFLGWIQSTWLVNQKRRLVQTDMHKLQKFDYRWIERVGSPREYFPIGLDVIGFYPRPSSSTDAVEVVGMLIPKPYDDEDAEIKVRREYRWALTYFAMAEFYASRGDADSAEQFRQRYLSFGPLRGKYQESKEREFRYRSQKEPWGTAPT